jgi:hypothetical protein
VAFGAVSETAAVLLQDTNRIRFVATGVGTSTITFKAWDRTAGQAGDVGVETTDPLNSFSDVDDTATIVVAS